MRIKLLIAAILTLTAVSTDHAYRDGHGRLKGNPGGADSRHPDHSSAEPRGQQDRGRPLRNRIASQAQLEKDDDARSRPHSSLHLLLVRKQMTRLCHRLQAHIDDDTRHNLLGHYGTVGWDSDDDKFTFTGDNDTGKGKYTSERVELQRIDRRRQQRRRLFALRRRPDLCNRVLRRCEGGAPAAVGRIELWIASCRDSMMKDSMN